PARLKRSRFVLLPGFLRECLGAGADQHHGDASLDGGLPQTLVELLGRLVGGGVDVVFRVVAKEPMRLACLSRRHAGGDAALRSILFGSPRNSTMSGSARLRSRLAKACAAPTLMGRVCAARRQGRGR